MNIIKSQSLLHYNTFKMDVVAELFSTVNNEDELKKLLAHENVIQKNKFAQKSSKLPLINEHFLAHKFLLDNFYSFYSKNNYLENGEMIIS